MPCRDSRWRPGVLWHSRPWWMMSQSVPARTCVSQAGYLYQNSSSWMHEPLPLLKQQLWLRMTEDLMVGLECSELYHVWSFLNERADPGTEWSSRGMMAACWGKMKTLFPIILQIVHEDRRGTRLSPSPTCATLQIMVGIGVTKMPPCIQIQWGDVAQYRSCKQV